MKLEDNYEIMTSMRGYMFSNLVNVNRILTNMFAIFDGCARHAGRAGRDRGNGHVGFCAKPAGSNGRRWGSARAAPSTLLGRRHPVAAGSSAWAAYRGLAGTVWIWRGTRSMDLHSWATAAAGNLVSS